jgi:hypothetical protein
MKSAASARRPRTSGVAHAARLLAVRKAAAAFDSPFALRSPRYELLLAGRAAWRVELDELRAPLHDALHAAVPAAAGRAERRRLLEWKRDVFNARPLSTPVDRADGPPPSLAADLRRYAELVRRDEALFRDGAPAVAGEVRAGLAALLADTRFRLACRYSSPDLWEALEHGSGSGGADLLALGRGLYAYAARFTAKANPFHVFAQVVFPPASGIQPQAEHEVVLDASLILEMEREALTHAADRDRIRLAPRARTLEEGRYRFWVPTPKGFRLLSLPAGPALDAIDAFFRRQARRTGNPTGTQAECEAFLCDRLGADAGDPAPLLDALAAKGLVERYLVTDTAEFAADLRGFTPELDGRLDRLGPLHLAQVSTADLATAEEALSAAAGPDGAGYHVNSYARAETGVHARAAAAVADDLRALKPFFLADHNFAANDAVARAFVLEWLSARGTRSAPLLALLGDFIRELDTLIARHRPAGDAEARAWRSAMAGEAGSLSPARLAELHPPGVAGDRSLCFNGPYDYVDGVFHLSNVWAGEGRFVSRYLLGRPPTRRRPGDRDGSLHVELAVPPRTNLECVVRAHSTGCGFDARQSHAFRRWVDPSDVVVEAADGAVAYRHAPSGRPLRIHYRGFLLAEYLPAEYQLLLVGHADTFANPFELPDTPGVAEVRRFDALSFGRVCLRRERWAVPAAMLGPTSAAAGDWLRAAAELRDRVREATSADEELWYYRTSNRAAGGYKPRFLDLRNPLGMAAFRRDLAALPEGAVVSLSPMRPAPEHLFRHDGTPYVTELMVEA